MSAPGAPPSAEVRCPACDAPRSPGAVFCGRCGAGVSDGVPVPREDPLTRAALDEAGLATAPVAGLVVALLSYLLVLLVSFAPAFVQVESMRDYRLFDGLIIVVGALAALLTHRTARGYLDLPRLTSRGAALAVLGMGLVFGVANLMLAFVPSGDDQLLAAYRGDGYGLGMVLVDVSLLPAIGEELVFRGVILSGFFKVFRARNAVILSAFLFATIHLSPLSFLHLTVLGIVLGIVRIKSGSLYPCILCHAGYNAAVVLSAW